MRRNRFLTLTVLVITVVSNTAGAVEAWIGFFCPGPCTHTWGVASINKCKGPEVWNDWGANRGGHCTCDWGPEGGEFYTCVQREGEAVCGDSDFDEHLIQARCGGAPLGPSSACYVRCWEGQGCTNQSPCIQWQEVSLYSGVEACLTIPGHDPPPLPGEDPPGANECLDFTDCECGAEPDFGIPPVTDWIKCDCKDFHFNEV